jgi:hypothetical protein
LNKYAPSSVNVAGYASPAPSSASTFSNSFDCSSPLAFSRSSSFSNNSWSSNQDDCSFYTNSYSPISDRKHRSSFLQDSPPSTQIDYAPPDRHYRSSFHQDSPLSTQYSDRYHRSSFLQDSPPSSQYNSSPPLSGRKSDCYFGEYYDDYAPSNKVHVKRNGIPQSRRPFAPPTEKLEQLLDRITLEQAPWAGVVSTRRSWYPINDVNVHEDNFPYLWQKLGSEESFQSRPSKFRCG